ncbi:MAG: hypothetical protein ACKOPS_22215 [Cyanobium sp.]
MATVESSSESQALLLHQSTTAGITWRVLLRPELRRAGESEVVEFQKLGRKGKLIGQVIGWGGGSWRSEPSRKVPQWLRTEVVGRHNPEWTLVPSASTNSYETTHVTAA